jgi:hypothetical protein
MSGQTTITAEHAKHAEKPNDPRRAQRLMSSPRLIAVDGASGRAVEAAARRLAPIRGSTAHISRWDASGLFEQLVLEPGPGVALSPRLLLLLYAADLAFRLRWEIDPMLAEGHTVVAASYVDTAVAFGRACDVPAKWLTNLFSFARTPSDRHVVGTPMSSSRKPEGFVEFARTYVKSIDSRSVGTFLRTAPRSRRGMRAPR